MIALIAALALLGAGTARDAGAQVAAAVADSAGTAAESAHPAGAGSRPADAVRALMRTARDDAHAYGCRRTAVVLLSGGALTGVSLAVEDADATARHLSGTTWRHVADLGNAYGSPATLGLGAIALLGAGQLSGNANLRGAGFDAGRSLFYTYVMVAGLKVAVGRTRPNGGRYSFPSGHAAGVCAVAPVLARRFGAKVAIPAYTLALATAIGRLETRSHYLSDVVFGAAIGTSVGLAIGSEGTEEPRLGFSPYPPGIRVAARF